MDTEVLGYPVIYERESEGNWGAYVPDLPGLGVGGSIKEEVEKLIQESTVFHIRGLKEAGLPIPAPTKDTIRELQDEYNQILSEHEMWTGKYDKCRSNEDNREQQICLERLKELGNRAINIQKQIKVLTQKSPTKPQ
jgi:predicted RNase H-like HicB family nuclease